MRAYAANFANESVESKGSNLEKEYAILLGGKIVGGIGDGGVDIILEDNPTVPIFQVKSSMIHALAHLEEGARRGYLIPVVVGDPGMHTREEILKSLAENGAWVGIDEVRGDKFVAYARDKRKQILENGGRIKGVK